MNKLSVKELLSAANRTVEQKAWIDYRDELTETTSVDLLLKSSKEGLTAVVELYNELRDVEIDINKLFKKVFEMITDKHGDIAFTREFVIKHINDDLLDFYTITHFTNVYLSTDSFSTMTVSSPQLPIILRVIDKLVSSNVVDSEHVLIPKDLNDNYTPNVIIELVSNILDNKYNSVDYLEVSSVDKHEFNIKEVGIKHGFDTEDILVVTENTTHESKGYNTLAFLLYSLI